MREFISSLKLRWTNLAFVSGLIPFAVLLIFGQLFMQHPDPNEVALPLWAGILCFIFLLGCWGYYIYIEVWKKRKEFNSLNSIIISVLFTLVFLNIIAIIVQPSHSTESVIIRSNEDISLIGTSEVVSLDISGVHRAIFSFELISSALCIYIGLFVLPKRFTSISFIKYLGYLFFLFSFVLIIYSYITESANYVGFIKYVFNIDRPEGRIIYEFTVQSFILHRNAYGMMMMIAIVFSLICHEFNHKWYYYLLAIFFYISMVFSLCKTGLLISGISLFVYIFYRLIKTYKEHKKRNKNAIISILSVIFIIGLIFGIAYVSKGKYLGKVYSIIESITRGGLSMDMRSFIWDNSYQLMRNGWWLIGRGFGTFNVMLEQMNIVSHGEHVFPSHSSYIGLLAEGGILFLISYLLLLIYSGYVICKCYKKEPGKTLTVSIGYISFVLYSFIETIHYLAYVFLFPIMVIYFSIQKEKQAE